MRIGVFGGTFDPIHQAHLIVAREARGLFQLDHVLFVPAAHPPHKAGSIGASWEHRYRMVELACRDEEGLEASRLEAGEETSYTILTIEKLRAELTAGDELFFLIGADAFGEITTWHRWQELLGMVEFIVVTRPGHRYAVPPGARVSRLETVALPVSSSGIRRALEAGGAPGEVPAAVLDYIREAGIYRL